MQGVAPVRKPRAIREFRRGSFLAPLRYNNKGHIVPVPKIKHTVWIIPLIVLKFTIALLLPRIIIAEFTWFPSQAMCLHTPFLFFEIFLNSDYGTRTRISDVLPVAPSRYRVYEERYLSRTHGIYVRYRPSWIRTNAYSSQSAVPYHLAIGHRKRRTRICTVFESHLGSASLPLVTAHIWWDGL